MNFSCSSVLNLRRFIYFTCFFRCFLVVVGGGGLCVFLRGLGFVVGFVLFLSFVCLLLTGSYIKNNSK